MVRNQAPASLTIGSLATAAGVGVETVRFYQRKGLLDEPTRESGIRRYGGADLRRLRFIRKAQAAGFTLRQVAELLALDGGEDRARVRALARARIAALDAQIAALASARDALAHLAAECGSGRGRSCPILDSFGV